VTEIILTHSVGQAGGGGGGGGICAKLIGKSMYTLPHQRGYVSINNNNNNKKQIRY
jgi:hypothetical protein